MINSKDKITAIIVDDEVKAIKLLKYQLALFCKHVEVVGTAQGVDEAKVLIEKYRPFLVFLDIEMPEKSGFELFDEVEVTFQTVFVTSYSQYAIKAFEVSAIDYLLKPVEEERLQEAIEKVIKQREGQLAYVKVLQANLENGKISQIVIPNNEYKLVIKTNDIICAEANRAYTEIYYIKDGALEIITYTRNLNYFADLVKEDAFLMRTHRSWIININKIVKYLKSNRSVELEMGVKTILSRNIIKEFEDKIK